MTGTLKAQLAQYGMSERLPEVLEECVRGPGELGHPISATPFSQLLKRARSVRITRPDLDLQFVRPASKPGDSP